MLYSQTNSLNFNILQLIISGTVSIVSGKKTTKQMICGSVGANTVAAISTGLSLIILALRMTLSYYFLNISAHYFVTVSIDRSSEKNLLVFILIYMKFLADVFLITSGQSGTA
ncbi:unnamed protein product [Gulo gulo]|uniref:Uncharacterized protein n=1 Tax=Gulo gulo TaxID=48420 RepID=A0A9X9LFJ5_GULGU|nr:unnamed protein product [Gulo gulo]